MVLKSRIFKLASPHMHGEDVRGFQRDLQGRFDAWKINMHVVEDGDYGGGTRAAAMQVCKGLGILHEEAMKDGVTPELRSKIRDPKKRTHEEITRSNSAATKGYRDKLRTQFKDAGATFDGHAVAPWMLPSLQWARENGWSGQLRSGYRSCEHQKVEAAKYAQRSGKTVEQIYPHGPCASNHTGLEYPHGAVDVTEFEELDRVLRDNPHKPGLVWGGPIIGDQVHFSADGH